MKFFTNGCLESRGPRDRAQCEQELASIKGHTSHPDVAVAVGGAVGGVVAVSVGGTRVLVGGTGVLVGGIGVSVSVGVGSEVEVKVGVGEEVAVGLLVTVGVPDGGTYGV